MRVLALNGSPRKTWNTATLLKKALEGAASQGAETTLVHLYDLKFTGCKSCFGCKLKDGPSYGKCAARDELTPILDEIPQTDVILLGTPVYFGGITGEMKSAMERLMFPVYMYRKDGEPRSLLKRTIPVAILYTMNCPEDQLASRRYTTPIELNEGFLRSTFGKAESFFAFDTYQFDDYAKIDQTRFDSEQKAEHRKQQFPRDCQRAFELGARLASEAR